MANPRQRKKARAPAHKKTRPSSHAKRNLRKMKAIRGPKALQEAWDKKKTLKQNYAALGLASSLKQVDSGGCEPLPMPFRKLSAESASSTHDSSVTANEERSSVKFGRIIRNAEGEIIDVQIPGDDGEKDEETIDNNVTNTHSTRVDAEQSTELIETLEQLAASAKSVKRFSSEREIVELKNLLLKHGRDFEAMAKDRRLNPWQRTAGQLQRASKRAGL